MHFDLHLRSSFANLRQNFEYGEILHLWSVAVEDYFLLLFVVDHLHFIPDA